MDSILGERLSLDLFKLYHGWLSSRIDLLIGLIGTNDWLIDWIGLVGLID